MASCGKQNSGGGDGTINITPDVNVKADLKISCSASQQEMDIITGLGAAFKKYYPNVTVTPEPIGGNNAISTVMGWYRANAMPDILQLSSYEKLNLKNAGVLLNLQPYIDAEQTAGSFNVADFYESYWQLGQSDFNGDQYLIPRSADTVVCQVNKRILADAGFPYYSGTLEYVIEVPKGFYDVCFDEIGGAAAVRVNGILVAFAPFIATDIKSDGRLKIKYVFGRNNLFGTHVGDNNSTGKSFVAQGMIKLPKIYLKETKEI